MVSMGTIKNILAYIEGSGRVALENKHLKVKELPALQQNIFTPKGYVDWDFVWKNDRVIIVSRAKEAGIETPPEKGHYHLCMRSIVQVMHSIKSQRKEQARGLPPDLHEEE